MRRNEACLPATGASPRAAHAWAACALHVSACALAVGACARALSAGARALAACALALAACSDIHAVEPRFHPIERPALVVAPDAPPVPARVAWLAVEPARGEVEVLRADRTEVLSDPGEGSSAGLLKLYGRDRKTIGWTTPRAGRVDRLTARVAIDRYDTLRVRWMRGGEELATEDVPLFPVRTPREYVVETPPAAERIVDRVELTVRGEGPAAIGRVELHELEGVHRLPAPGEPPEFVAVGEDVRPAYGLAPKRPFEIAFDATPNGVLVVSAAIPPRLCVPGDDAVLSVEVHGLPGGVRAHRYPLLEADSQSSGWVWVRIPVEGQGGERLRARFVLESTNADAAVCALTQPQVVSFADDAPTVLLVTSDTHRGDHVAYAPGAAPVQTPVLDALAARGVAFTDAWAPSNVTIPSHVSILTGVPLRDTGILDNTHALAPGAVTLAEVFAAAGWATVAAVSASHLDANWSGLGQGFDRMAVSTEAKRPAGKTLAHLERWLPDYRGRPLFVWLHLFDAHTPYQPPSPFRELAWDPRRDPRDPALPEPHPATVPGHLPGVRDLDYVVALYRGEVGYLDSEMARLLERTRFRDAIVAFTSDHGESFGSHGVYWDHGGLYRDRLHVPLVLAWPGAPAGTRLEARVSLVDVGRTLLDLVGLATADYPGSNLLAAHRDPGPVHAVACFGFSAAVVDGDHLLILHLRDHLLHDREASGARQRHAVELYDVRADPECAQELSASRPEVAAELRAGLVHWLRSSRAQSWRAIPAGSVEILANLAALGYAQGLDPSDPDGALFPAQCACEHCARFAR